MGQKWYVITHIKIYLISDHDFHPVSSQERRFLAWQTWDLLRVCVYGFKKFCEDFLTHHPG